MFWMIIFLLLIVLIPLTVKFINKEPYKSIVGFFTGILLFTLFIIWGILSEYSKIYDREVSFNHQIKEVDNHLIFINSSGELKDIHDIDEDEKEIIFTKTSNSFVKETKREREKSFFFLEDREFVKYKIYINVSGI